MATPRLLDTVKDAIVGAITGTGAIITSVTDTVSGVLTSTLKGPARGPARARPPGGHDQDFRKGAVEVAEPASLEHGSRNAPALGADGLPADVMAITEARFGANVDDHEVSQAGETGQSADTSRDEELEIERHVTGR